ncbi:MAG: sulfinoalanine decarboxylase [Bacteroidia bacterium]|jgi:sulfinoalanine decarboxylase
MSEPRKLLQSDLKLFNELVEVLLDEEEENPVAERIEIPDLHHKLDLTLGDNPIVDEELKERLKELVIATPKTATKLFFNQLFGGRQSKAILGDLLAVMLNNSMYTYKVAGPQVAVEMELIKKSCEQIGYGAKSGGTIPTGGSMSNYMALVMARDRAEPQAKETGIQSRLVMYTSRISHYSNAKNASFSGVGRKNVRYIDADDFGCMMPEALNNAMQEDIKAGFKPFYVNATAGTTVLGSFDPINAIADVCDKYNVWLHVDGAYCGGAIFSKTYKPLMAGLERSDSFSYNAHKLLGTPLTCSVILVKDKSNLVNSFSNEADYLYQTDDDEYNLGKTSFQCGRRNDALKFWTLWKSIGTNGLETIIDKQFRLAQVARDYVVNHPDYNHHGIDSSISVCFNYKNIDPDVLCTALYEEGQTVVGFGSFQEVTFVRLVTISANNTEDDILHFFKIIEDFVARSPTLLEETKSISV